MYLSPEQIKFLNAADQGDVETVQAMLAAGVDVNTPDDRRLPRNRTALMHAAKNGHLDVAEVLLDAGADVNVRDRGMGFALPGGHTALLLALENKQARVAERLLQAGADPRAKSGDLTVFGLAAYLGDVAVVRQLLKLGLDPDSSLSKRADLPLPTALFAKQTEVVRALLSPGANSNLPGRGRVTPLEIAIKEGCVEAVQLLLHHGANPNRVSAKGSTPLQMAVLGGQKEIVKILLKRDIAVNARNPRGQTALDLAQQQLDRDVDEDFVSSLQRQDLDVAGFLKRYQEMATLLRAAGAKTADRLPPEPRGRSGSAPSKRRGPDKPRQQPDSMRLGVKDFLELLDYTEPQFAVIAVKAPIEKAAGAFVDFRNATHWTRDVPRGAGARPARVKASVTAAVKVKRNLWTVILRSIFRFGDNDHKLVVEDAKALSARLKTKAIAFIRENKAEAVGYDLFENGRLAEHAQWVEESSFCWFKSRFRRKPEKGELGEEFTDKVFRQQGIYLPACYPRYKKKGSWLCVEKVSAPAIERADIIVLPGRKKRRRK